MRFTAEISCFESRFDDQCNQTQLRHFETEDIVANITIQRPGQKRSLSVPPASFGSPRKRSGRKSGLSRLTEDELLELYKMSYGGGSKNSEEEKRKEEELRRKLMRKPSRKISREGDYLVIQDRKGVLMSQTGAQEVEERRVLINSEEYKCFMKEGSIKV